MGIHSFRPLWKYLWDSWNATHRILDRGKITKGTKEAASPRGSRGGVLRISNPRQEGRRRVSAHNPVRWQLIIPHLPILTLSCLASAPSQPLSPAPSTRASSSFSSYTPNRAFSIPPSFTSIRIRLALSVRRVITLINKMEVGMREFCPLFLSPSVVDVSRRRCRRRRLHVFSSIGHESIARRIRAILSARQVSTKARTNDARLHDVWTYFSNNVTSR